MVGESLVCVRERGNQEDPYAVSINKDQEVVGHVPRLISAFCSSFLCRGGRITCLITGTKRYSRDLVQGGMEVPCIYICEGEAQEISKAEKLLSQILCHPDLPTSIRLTTNLNEDVSNLSDEASVIEVEDNISSPGSDTSTTTWVMLDHCYLTSTDKDTLINGLELNDKHMTYAQMLLHQQFPHIIGLQSTLLQQKKPSCPLELQIIHSRNNHWIVCSTINSLPWQVDIYDTLFKSLDHNTTTVVHNLFGDELEANMVPIQKQVGGLDCGPFAIAIATSLAFDVPPQNRQFNQQVMRQHIVDCFQKSV